MASVAFVANPAEAAIFTVGGTNYDVTTVTGSYNSLKSQLEATPWWGNSTLAADLATAATSAGSWNNDNGGMGAFFAFNTFWDAYTANAEGGGALGADFANSNYLVQMENADIVYAAPAAVPEPLTILGSITAAGFGVAFKRKKNSNKEEWLNRCFGEV